MEKVLEYKRTTFTYIFAQNGSLKSRVRVAKKEKPTTKVGLWGEPCGSEYFLELDPAKC